MNNNQVKRINAYIILKSRADAEMLKLSDELCPFVDASFEEMITRKKTMSLEDMDKIKELSGKIKLLQKDIDFYESKIASSQLYNDSPFTPIYKLN